MQITNEQLRQIIKEELESVLDEQNFDTETGRAITDRGRKIEGGGKKDRERWFRSL